MFAFDFLFKEISGLFSNKFHANNFTDIYFLQKKYYNLFAYIYNSSFYYEVCF